MIVRSLAVCAVLLGLFLFGISSADATPDKGSPSTQTAAPLDLRSAAQIEPSAAVTVSDPFTEALRYSTFVDPNANTSIFDVAVDGEGNAIAVGQTESYSLTLINPYQSTWTKCDRPGTFTGVIVKLNPTGDQVLFSTYFGGGCFDSIHTVDVDDEGNIYVAGYTNAENFPTLNPLFTSFALREAFVAKFSPQGQLFFSTLLGGDKGDEIRDMAIGPDGSIYVGGLTSSGNLPVKNARYPSLQGINDGFVAKLAGDGSQLIYLTYLGGNERDNVEGVAVGPDGGVYLTGVTHSEDFPVQGSLGGFGADNTAFTGFVTHLSADGQTLHYSTFLGGSSDTHAFAIDADDQGNVYVTGLTASPDFPITEGVYMTTKPAVGYQVFVASLNVTGTLRYGTYFGAGIQVGNAASYGYAIAVDRHGNAYVAGQTLSLELPMAYPVQQTFAGGREDAFAFKLDATGSELVFSTYLGSSASDQITGIAVDGYGGLYVTGITRGKDWPTTPGAVSETFSGCCISGFVSRITTLPWTVIFYRAFDNDLDYAAQTLNDMELNMDNPHVEVLVLHDLNSSVIYSDSVYYAVQPDNDLAKLAAYKPGVSIFIHQELDTSQAQTLADFVKWARTRYPSRHQALLLDSHGSGVTGAFPDYQNRSMTQSQATWMSVSQLGQAMSNITDNGNDKVDIIYGVACLMGMIEPAYELRHSVDYYVASEQIYWWTTQMITDTIKGLTRDISPEAYARYLMESYAQDLGQDGYPYTLSIADLSKIDPVHSAVHGFGDALNAYLSTASPAEVQQFSDLVKDAQHFDSTGDLQINPDFDEYVDLYDWALIVHLTLQNEAVSAAAQTLTDAIDAYILDQRAASGYLTVGASQYYWDHSNVHGVTIFEPRQPRSFYNSTNFSFLVPPPTGARSAGQSSGGWKAFLESYAAIVNPGAPDDPTPPPLVAWINTEEPIDRVVYDLYLPSVQR